MSETPDPPELPFLRGGGEMGALMRGTDWAASPLGPAAQWPPALKMTVSLLLANRFPQLLWWGPDYISIYNDAYRPVLGAKHPAALGKPVREVWSEVEHVLAPLIDIPFHGGPSSWADDMQLEIHRHGFTEETHFTVAYSPVPDETAPRGIGGVLATVSEITEQILDERRLAALRDLAASIGGTRSSETACAEMAAVLAAYPLDVPFALVYLVDGEGSPARLAGVTGMAADSPAAPALIDLQSPAPPWPLAQTSKSAVKIDLRRMLHLPPGPWTDPPHTALVIPMITADKLTSFLIAGTSARLRLDKRYLDFLDLIAKQIATAIDNARAYEQERERAEALVAIDHAKTAFFSNISHEFRTPLTLILGPLEDALAESASESPQRARLETVQRNGLRLLRLVNTLLDFARVEAGRTEANYQPTDLFAFTADIASCFRSTCEKAGLALTIHGAPLTTPVFVDRVMWEKIVLNLLSNAFKFTFHGGIDVELTEDANQVLLRISDTGAGIPDSELPRLFERFHRVEGVRGRTHEGTGIGLALVQELVHLHQGSIAAESQDGLGTRFTVRLPLGHQHLPDGRIDPAGSEPSIATNANAFVAEASRWLPDLAGETSADIPPVPAGPKDSIVIAEDNADMREYLGRLLGQRYVVQLTCNGAEALDAVRRQRPDLVLSDIMMPELDGYGLLRSIKGDPALTDLPVVLLSARAGQDATIEGLDAGADDYLIKPFTARELIARVAANLQHVHDRRQVRISEDRFRSLFNAIDDGFCIIEFFDGPHGPLSDYVHLEANPGYERHTGIAGIVGKTLRQIAPGDADGWLELYGGVLRTGEPLRFERFFKEAGRPIEVSAARVEPASRNQVSVLFRDIKARKQAEEALRTSEAVARENIQRVQLALSAGAIIGTWLWDLPNDRFSVDEAFAHAFGLDPAMGHKGLSLEQVFATVHPDDKQGLIDAINKAMERGGPYAHQYRVRRLDGHYYWIEANGRVELAPDGTPLNFPGVLLDVEEKRAAAQERDRAAAALRSLNETLEQRVAVRTAELMQVEERLRQSQKMEAVGQLTGGLAHDFNNLLAGISGAMEMINARLHQGRVADIDKYVVSAQGAVRRAAALTHRLLAFSRRQTLDPRPLNVNNLVSGMTDLIQRTVGPGILVETVGATNLWTVRADPNHLENALLNLCINARDAMPDGGQITIETANKWLDRDAARTHELPEGQYLSLCVTDNGTGMTPDVIANAFDPFFTTKPLGQGTGLGLSMIYGFTKQSGGHVRIYSEVGMGTTVCLYLPRHYGEAAREEAVSERPPAPHAETGETVLIVDDEPTVRMLVTDVLQELGYHVIEAADSISGLKALQSDARIDLLVSDVGLPGGMNGRQMAEAGRQTRPGLKVLFITGYAENSVIGSGHLEPGMQVLTKPFAMEALAARVKELMLT